jgi:acyl carrier protein
VDEIKLKIEAFLELNLGGQLVADTDDIFELGYVTSLFVMQLVTFLEKEFDLTIGPADLEFERFRTVTAMATLVNAKKGLAA